MGNFLDENSNEVFFLLDGKTAQDVAGLGGNNSAEDFVLYNEETMGTVTGTPDTRGQVKEDGRRVGLRTISRELSNPLHPKIKVTQLIMCIMHCFSRVTEGILRLTAGVIAEGVALNQYLEGEKEARMSKSLLPGESGSKILMVFLISPTGSFENILNGVISGKEIAFEFSHDGKPLPISLNGQKAKRILAAAFNGQLPLQHILPNTMLSCSVLLQELFSFFNAQSSGNAHLFISQRVAGD